MTNLLLTNRCNQDCPYCFAVDYRKADASGYLSEERFWQFLDYLDRSKIQQARLLGGEPTLHPQFDAFVKLAWQRGKKIVVFSNGYMPPKALSALLDLPEDACHVLVNITAGNWLSNPRSPQNSRPIQVLSRLKNRAQLSYTIHRQDFDLTPAIELIDKTNCQRSIRVGIAHPATGQNRSIHPKQYRAIGRRLASFAAVLKRWQITIELDCGFVRCMFSTEEMELLNQSGAHLAWRCSPVIDLDVNGQAAACFPLSEIASFPNALEKTAEELRQSFNQKLHLFRIVGIYPECSSCTLRVTEKCSAGCLSHALQRLRKDEFQYHYKLYSEINQENKTLWKTRL